MVSGLVESHKIARGQAEFSAVLQSIALFGSGRFDLMIKTRKLHVKIEGLEPGYMQSRIDPRTFGQDSTKKTGSNKRDPKRMHEEAFEKVYFNDHKQPCIPSKHIRGSLIDAAKDFKMGRRSYRELFAASVNILPELIPITPPQWELNVDIANNRHVGRIPVARPRFPGGWSAEFDIVVDDEQLTDETLKQILDHAGLRKGIGSYTPPHEGPYGRYIMREFKTL